MTTSFIFQTFLWNDVVRAAEILAGGASFARSAIVVTVGFQLTPFPLSASVSRFPSVPPHFAPGGFHLPPSRLAGRVSCSHSVPPPFGPGAAALACPATPATSAAVAAAR